MAVAAMALVILAYDQLLFRPIVAWADKFRFEQTAAQQRPRSWVYDIVRRTRLLRRIVTPLSLAFSGLARLRLPDWGDGRARAVPGWLAKATDAVWILLILAAAGYSAAFQLSDKLDRADPLWTLRRIIVPEWTGTRLLQELRRDF